MFYWGGSPAEGSFQPKPEFHCHLQTRSRYKGVGGEIFSRVNNCEWKLEELDAQHAFTPGQGESLSFP
jgi:hypothetical protein